MLELVDAIKSVSDRLLQEEQSFFAAATGFESGAPPATGTLAVSDVAPALHGVGELSAEEDAARLQEAVFDTVGVESHGGIAPSAVAALSGGAPALPAVLPTPGAAPVAADIGVIPGVGGGGGGGGGEVSRSLLPTLTVAGVAAAPEGAERVQILPPGLVVVGSENAVLRAPSAIATLTTPAAADLAATAAVAITTDTTSVVREAGTVHCLLPEGNFAIPTGTNGVIGNPGASASGDYDASGGYDGGRCDGGYPIQGPVQAPAAPLFAGVAAGFSASAEANRVAGVTGMCHRDSTRHVLAPRVNMPPPPARRDDGVSQAAQGGCYAPCWEERDSNGNGAYGDARGGVCGYGGAGRRYTISPSDACEGTPELRYPQRTGCEGDGGKGYGTTTMTPSPQRHLVGGRDGGGVGGRKRVETGGWGGGEVWGGGAATIPRHAGKPITTAAAPHRHYQQNHQRQHHQQERLTYESVTRAQRHVRARAQVSMQNRRSECRATEGGRGGSSGSGSHGSSSRGSGGGAVGGGVAAFHQRNNRRRRGNRSRRSGPRPREGRESSGASRHYHQTAFQETGAACQAMRQRGEVGAIGGSGNVARHPAAARAVHIVSAATAEAAVVGGGGGSRGDFYGGGTGTGDGRRWRGGGEYIPVPPCAAGYGNSGGCVQVAPPRWHAAACGPFAYQATAVGGAGYYQGQAGYGRKTGYGGHVGHAGRAGYVV